MLRLRIGGGMCNYMVFSLKYRGKVLVGDVALAAGAVMEVICEVVDMDIDPDLVALLT